MADFPIPERYTSGESFAEAEIVDLAGVLGLGAVAGLAFSIMQLGDAQAEKARRDMAIRTAKRFGCPIQYVYGRIESPDLNYLADGQALDLVIDRRRRALAIAEALEVNVQSKSDSVLSRIPVDNPQIFWNTLAMQRPVAVRVWAENGGKRWPGPVSVIYSAAGEGIRVAYLPSVKAYLPGERFDPSAASIFTPATLTPEITPAQIGAQRGEMKTTGNPPATDREKEYAQVFMDKAAALRDKDSDATIKGELGPFHQFNTGLATSYGARIDWMRTGFVASAQWAPKLTALETFKKNLADLEVSRAAAAAAAEQQKAEQQALYDAAVMEQAQALAQAAGVTLPIVGAGAPIGATLKTAINSAKPGSGADPGQGAAIGAAAAIGIGALIWFLLPG